MEREALLYSKNDDETVNCLLCSHDCLVYEGDVGICGVRKNVNGTLYTLNYGKIVAANVDPVEKKPLYHFFPGSQSYSIACMGCNFHCDFCQNWTISQATVPETTDRQERLVSAVSVVDEAIAANCKSISYTYGEPTVYFEFALAVAQIAKQRGLYNIFVTNGYMSKNAIAEIGLYLDAANIDLKSFSDEFYRDVCGGSLQPVLDSIILMKELGIWVEVTTLVIPNLNDSEEELKQIASFIAGVDDCIPWHISRFHPQYKMEHHSMTDLESLRRAYQIGKSCGLKYIYIGNVFTDFAQNTQCTECGKTVIDRVGFVVNEINYKDGHCSFCGGKIKGVGL